MAIYKKNKKKLIWITARDGFLGKNLFEGLNKKKFEVLGTTRNDIDLNDYIKINQFLKKIKPDIILQTAGLVGGIIRNKEQPFDLLNKNIKITTNLISSSYENLKDVNFINFVSSCIYPNNLKKRIKEENFDQKYIEKSSYYYSLAKIVSYQMSNLLFKEKKKYYNIVPSNLFGPYDNFNPEEGHVIPALISKMSRNKDIVLPGSGIARRDFLYIKDFVQAIVKFINKDFKSTNCYNLSSSKIISIKSLAYKIKKIYGFKGNIIFKQDDNDGTIFKSLSSKKFRDEFNWEEKYSFDKNLSETVDWFRRNYKS